MNKRVFELTVTLSTDENNKLERIRSRHEEMSEVPTTLSEMVCMMIEEYPDVEVNIDGYRACGSRGGEGMSIVRYEDVKTLQLENDAKQALIDALDIRLTDMRDAFCAWVNSK